MSDRDIWNEGYNAAKRLGASHREACNAGERAIRAARRAPGQLELEPTDEFQEPERETQQGANGAPINWKGY